MNARAFDSIRFRGEGTDLTVGLIPGASWIGAGESTPDGREFVPNLPTEEVFTSPDWRRTEGAVRVTRPVSIGQGGLVDGLRLRFEGGRIVDVQADSGLELVLAQLDTDEQARYLGEVALVDGASSAVARAGVVFHHMLFDENVGPHIAWGRAYPEALPHLVDADRADAPGRRAQRLDRPHRRDGRWWRRRGRRHHARRRGRPDHPRRQVGARLTGWRNLGDDEHQPAAEDDLIRRWLLAVVGGPCTVMAPCAAGSS